MKIDVEKLYKKYLTLNIPNPFTTDQIHRRLTETYFAKKEDLSRFSDLSQDPHAGFDKATGAYVFEDKRGIEKLIRLNRDDEIDKDGQHAYVINSTLIGGSLLLNLELHIFKGIDKEEIVLGNLRFEEYLIALYITGYIQFENDPVIDKVIERYRDGYYLRYFGMQSGFENYLYK
jgi:hypothetical protein